jgi:hypothetical protein
LSEPTASVSDRTGKKSSPSTTAASCVFATGRSSAPMRCRLAVTAAGSTPRAAWIPPSSDSSPRISTSFTSFLRITPAAARTPIAIGRSNDAPAFRTSAGARLTTMR